MKNRRLNLLERSWLLMDSPSTPMHIGALLIFGNPGDSQKQAAALAERLYEAADVQAPWNLKLSGALGLSPWPAWQVDTKIDLEYHLRRSALPAPGGERELGMLISRLHAIALDRSRPLWECHIIERLHDNQFALYFKAHRALMDAGELLHNITRALSADAASRDLPAIWSLPTETAWTEREARFKRSLGGLISREAWHDRRELWLALRRLRQAKKQRHSDLPPLYSVPRSALNVQVDAQRRIATQQFDQPRLERVARAADATLGEIVLYLCSSVIRRFLKEYNALPEDSLIAAMVGLRVHEKQGEVAASNVGGSIGLYRLGTDWADPLRRLQVIRDSVFASHAHLEAMPATLRASYTLMVAAPLLMGRITRVHALTPRLFNLPISDLHGPAQPVYLDGAKLQAVYPVLPLAQDTALSIACYRYANTFNFGLAGAREALPHLQRLAVYMEAALTDLEEALEGEV